MSIEISLSVRNIIKDKCKLNKQLLVALDKQIQNCNTMLSAVKLKVSTLQLQMTAMKFMYHDIMELRKLIVILHPHLKEKGKIARQINK